MDTIETTYGKRELWALLDQATTAISRVADNELSEAGITMIQGAVLHFVKSAKEQAGLCEKNKGSGKEEPAKNHFNRKR